MALVHCEVSEGPRPGFKLIGVQDAEGQKEFLVIEERFLVKSEGETFLPVQIIGKDPQQNVTLIELPVEADSGANRVWVPSNELHSKQPDGVIA